MNNSGYLVIRNGEMVRVNPRKEQRQRWRALLRKQSLKRCILKIRSKLSQRKSAA